MLNNKQLAALYIELSAMYHEEFPDLDSELKDLTTVMAEKIKQGALSKKEILRIEPIFVYGHVDVHRYIKAKKRFIWF